MDDQDPNKLEDYLPLITGEELTIRASTTYVQYTSCWLPTTTVMGRIYKKQEEEASMAAILWRKKLVLHKSLAGVSIGISQNPIMHANSERPRDPLSRAEDNRSPETACRRPENESSERRRGTIRLRYGDGPSKLLVDDGGASEKENPFLLVFSIRFLSMGKRAFNIRQYFFFWRALELKFEEMERGLLIGAEAGWVDGFAPWWQRWVAGAGDERC